jgi:hypothetical protein
MARVSGVPYEVDLFTVDCLLDDKLKLDSQLKEAFKIIDELKEEIKLKNKRIALLEKENAWLESYTDWAKMKENVQ